MMSDDGEFLTRYMRQLLAEQGFDLVGIASPEYALHADHFRRWIESGRHGEMQYMERNVGRRTDLEQVLPGVRSVVCVAINYYVPDSPEDCRIHPLVGQVSKYALNEDYHAVIESKLGATVAALSERCPSARFKVYADTGPVLEKALAERAGVGWIGKHTNLISTKIGSWFFLAEILTDLDLVCGTPHENRCGTCQRCIEVCPTGALVGPYQLDARLCISYLTIELKGPIPHKLRPMLGNRIYGCDDCQEVCPWNRFARQASELAFLPRHELILPALIDLMSLTEEAFRGRFKGSPIKRIKRKGLLRNVAVALGKAQDRDAVPILLKSLRDGEPLIRGHVAWALGQIGGKEAEDGLKNRLALETDGWVRTEIAEALSALGNQPSLGSDACGV